MLLRIQPQCYKAFQITALNYFFFCTNFCYVLNTDDLDPEGIQMLK
jgi:hypothetical protein